MFGCAYSDCHVWFGTTTIPEHQEADSVTGEITPCSSILLISCFTFGRRGCAAFLGVYRQKGVALSLSLIEYSFWRFASPRKCLWNSCLKLGVLMLTMAYECYQSSFVQAERLKRPLCWCASTNIVCYIRAIPRALPPPPPPSLHPLKVSKHGA